VEKYNLTKVVISDIIMLPFLLSVHAKCGENQRWRSDQNGAWYTGQKRVSVSPLPVGANGDILP